MDAYRHQATAMIPAVVAASDNDLVTDRRTLVLIGQVALVLVVILMITELLLTGRSGGG